MSNNAEEQGLQLNWQLLPMPPFIMYSNCIVNELYLCIVMGYISEYI